jgi:hypothetical protein
LAANQLHRAAGALKFVGQQSKQGVIGGGVDRWGSHFDSQFITQGFADFVFAGARLQFDM